MTRASNSVGQSGTRLSGVTIAATNMDRAAAVFEMLLQAPGTEGEIGCAFEVGGQRVVIVAARAGEPAGLRGVSFAVPSLEAHAALVTAAGMEAVAASCSILVPAASANGIDVSFEPAVAAVRHGAGAATFDHVALVVADLPGASSRWGSLLNQQPDEVGPHPLGGSETVRFFLGEQMLELVSPHPGADTAISRRLAQAGDGPIALAIVPDDLRSASARLEAAGCRLVEQPPHLFVHPRDTGGVLLQLTPRLNHRG